MRRRSSRHLPDHLFRNDGGRFVDVTAQAGINDWHGQGLGVVANDLDDDGRLDLFVANDQSPNYFFRNLGDLRFEELAESTGLGGNSKGGFQASMGVACGDLDGDGRPDLGVTTFYNESTTFYHNLGGGVFVDHTGAIGLAVPTRYRLGFGLAFLDVNNDGHLDIAIANGHVDDFRPEIPYAMPAQLLLGSEGGQLTDVSARAGSPWQVPRVGRGLAAGDLDNDGRIDLLLLAQDGPLAYFHNRSNGGPFRDPPPRRRSLQSRRDRHPSDRHRGRPPSVRLAIRRRQLPVVVRPETALRPRRREPGRDARGGLAVGESRQVRAPRRRHRIPGARGQERSDALTRVHAAIVPSLRIWRRYGGSSNCLSVRTIVIQWR